MTEKTAHSDDSYSPLYFLASLGAGGLVVSFFMWLLFWVPHTGRPVPIFDDVVAAFQAGDLLHRAAIVTALIGIAFFGFQKYRLLLWNIRQARIWKATPTYNSFLNSHQETQLLAVPLTVAMSINVAFILGLVFVPGLWSVIEYLFLPAICCFIVVGVWALSVLGRFWGRLLTQGDFDCSKNNSFAQLLPSFALAMVGVGLAAPAAFSHSNVIAALSVFLSSFFIMAAVLLTCVHLVLALRSIMLHGASPESGPSLLIVIPILTVISIAWMRQNHGLIAHLGGTKAIADTFTFLTNMFVLQLIFALFGGLALARHGYFRRFVFGSERSAGSYALICPGVALAVMMQFLINKAVLPVGLIHKFDGAYWLLTAVPLIVQAATIWLFFVLNRRHFGGRKPSVASHSMNTPEPST